MSKARLFSPARKEAGFTLIELLTVIVIIGILAAIAIPVFTSQRARAQDSQTISDVRNIAVQAETIMSDPKSTYDDVTKANIDFSSSKNVSWNISGKASLGGYCIVAKNTAGKKYTTDATALTYDSLAGGVGRSGKACDGTTNPVVPNGSTGVGSDVSVSVAAPTNVNVNRGSQTSATVSWTIPTDTTVTGYVVQRATTNDDTAFTTVGTVTSRTTSTFTDTSAPSTAAYYRLMSTTADGTSSVKSTAASLGAYVASATFTPTASGFSGTTQTFTASANGNYKIEAWGASGGIATKYSTQAGRGAYASGTLYLTANQSVTVLVGQSGAVSSVGGGGGGGGTFIMSGTGAGAVPLVVAGGGGGAGSSSGQDASTGTSGGNSTAAGGTNGYGGGNWYSGGGGGYRGDGATSGTNGGKAFINGANGGSSSNYNTPIALGGYGGGGAGDYPQAGDAGGGGGYSGGGAGYSGGAGGGGSFVTSFFNGTSVTVSELNNTTKANNGDGKVVITRVN